MRLVTLTDGVLLLRPPRPADVDAIVAAVQDPEIPRWTSVPTPYGRTEAEAWISVDSVAGWRSGKEPVWHVCTVDAPEVPLASIGLHGVDLDAGIAEVGYWTAASARGRGLTTHALRLLCRWAFDELGLDRIDWQAYVGNDASRRVAEKVGFVVEGTTRDRLTAHGVRHDGWYGGLLPGELRLDDTGGAPEVRATWTGDDEPVAPLVPPAPGPVAPPGTEITAGAVHLRGWRPEDADDLAVAIADPDIGIWNAFDDQGGVTETALRWLASRADWSDGRHVAFATVDSTTGALLGGVSLHHLDLDTRTGEMGYWAMPAARGRGLTRTAVGAMTRWGFAVLDLHRIELWHGVENEASCALARGAGYAFEAATRESYRYGDGVRHDEHLHARLATD